MLSFDVCPNTFVVEVQTMIWVRPLWRRLRDVSATNDRECNTVVACCSAAHLFVHPENHLATGRQRHRSAFVFMDTLHRVLFALVSNVQDFSGAEESTVFLRQRPINRMTICTACCSRPQARRNRRCSISKSVATMGQAVIKELISKELWSSSEQIQRQCWVGD